MVAVLLLVAAILDGQDGEGPKRSVSTGGSDEVPAAVLSGGPIIDLTDPGAPGLRVPPKTIVLTFDDGPGPETGRILDVLDRYQVPGTFFVIGNAVAGRSGLLRRMADGGHEIGVHTFTHPDLAATPAWRTELEIEQTQLAIAAATGEVSDLIRPPFSSHPSVLTDDLWRAMTRVGNYRLVLTDLDTRDWARPGPKAIAAAATPEGSDGAVVMLHDAGGDRDQTVAALDTYIPDMLARGYTFATVSEAMDVPPQRLEASTGQRLRGQVTLATVQLSDWLVTGLNVLFIAAGALAVLRVLVLLLLARRHDRGTRRAARSAVPPDDASLPGVTVVVPAYNEAAGIAACVRSLAACDYPAFEIVVVDDGSTDDTAEIARSLGIAGVRVITQVNGGKPSALNTGIAAASYDVLVLVDGDTVFERDTLRALVSALEDERVGAVSGNTKVGNRRGLLGRWQHVEYVIGFNLDRRMFDVLHCMPTVPGAIGAFRRRALADVGGVSDDTLAEDTDLTMAICRAGWRVVYAPTALAWTEAPATLGQLWRQRYRWCYGTLQSMWKHRGAVLSRGAAGKLGRRGLSYLFLFQVLLPLLAPVIDVAAVYGLFTEDWRVIGLTWLAFLAVQFIGAAYAFRLDGERLRALWVLPLQQVVYRQVMYLVVIESVASAFYGIRLRWHKLQRAGAENW
ncbi:bifunctional polysaccharide deacetylase/glycosyltransferase family 2 protein [Nocardioides speluncae]|uniref:bifunctional polysaccharide deacetylase/glycosyltransferase family 2 protein n=1 Tax=Nocardioides speluncae TaxID=2670337 RepID=UPI001F0BBD15|nr:bifunctional polysaccharide deacetylase/glycosyltransferase family 2 protein [Nocardioides speluncae]